MNEYYYLEIASIRPGGKERVQLQNEKTSEGPKNILWNHFILALYVTISGLHSELQVTG
jgi:hypothetical protein